MCDFPIQTDKILEHNRPDVTVIDKKNKKCVLIDRACPRDTCIDKNVENEKGRSYTSSNRGIRNSNKAL